MKHFISRCPICGSSCITTNKIIVGENGYFLCCEDCGFSGRTKLFPTTAQKAWNKDSSEILKCTNCKNKHTMKCPNSSLCYSLEFHPYWKPKKQTRN